MMPSMIVNAILCLGVVVMVVSPLAWAVRTAHRDLPVRNTNRRPEPATPRTRRPEHAPRFGGTRAGQAWPTS